VTLVGTLSPGVCPRHRAPRSALLASHARQAPHWTLVCRVLRDATLSQVSQGERSGLGAVISAPVSGVLTHAAAVYYASLHHIFVASFANPTGASACTLCGPSVFGNTTELKSAVCSGPCAAGYYCLPGSTNASAAACPIGQFSSGGASACQPCNSGNFGNAPARTTGFCSGICQAGYYCPDGSTNSTAAMCPTGTYSVGGSSICQPCPAGQYGSTSAMTSPSCTGPCDAGRFGSLPGLTTPSCSGACTAGYSCPAGSTNGTAVVCPVRLHRMSGLSLSVSVWSVSVCLCLFVCQSLAFRAPCRYC
jgi:hypothetical protein